MWTRLRLWFAALSRRTRFEHQLDDELAFHMQSRAEEWERRGLSAAAARRRARIEFGNVERIKEETRDVRLGARVERTGREIRRCLRSFARNPLFTGVAVLTLALAAGAAIAIFTIVNAVLLRPLPFPDADRLVMIGWSGSDGRNERISGPLYFRYADESRTLDAVSAFSGEPANVTDPDGPLRVVAARVTPAFFGVLRTPPRLGRTLAAADARPDAPPVAVLGDALWRARFGADPGLVGRIIDIDATRTEVVGVMPPGFSFPEPETALWRPLPLDRETTQLGNFFYQGVARLADGVTAAQGQAELETLVSDLPEVFPDQFAAPYLAERGFRPLIVPLLETVVGDIRATLWLLLSAVGILLLVACVNVANLFLVRSEARTDEWAIRLALGAHRRGLAVALLLESVLLGLAGGAAALPIAWLAVRALVRNAPRDLPRLDEVSVDGSVLLFGLAVSIVGGLLCGLLPAWRASAVGTTANLTAGARGATDGRNRQLARRGLVVAQISLAVTLLVGSGLAMRSFQRLAAVDPGFDPADALTFGVTLPGRVYMTSASRLVFHRQMLERLSGLPGVSGAAAATAMPLTSYAALSNHDIEGWDGADGVQPVLPWKQVSPGYFETMGTTLLEGREFDRLDAGRAPVAIVSRSLARTYWPGEPTLGKGLRPGGLPAPAGDEWFRVVGVVEDVHETTLHDDPPAMGYYPMAVAGADGEMAFVRPSMRYVVRGPNATALTAGVREIVRDLDPRLPIADVSTLEALAARARAQRAFVMILLIVAAAFSLLLGAVGLYGVIAYMVTRRRREIAIRMAVGAEVAAIRRLVLAEAGGLALAGAALGSGAAMAVTRQLQALLFETSPLEPAIFATVAAVLAATCLLASWLPARRATNIDPMAALRPE